VRTSGKLVGAVAPMVLAVVSVCVGSVSAATQPRARSMVQWQAELAQLPRVGSGCYHASYPAVQWHAVTCEVAPVIPLAPALTSSSVRRAAPEKVGDRDDYSAVVSGLISAATGSFDDVSPKITERGRVGGDGSRRANTFTLQLNSQFFSTPACSNSEDPSTCTGWQQFVYETDSDTVFMQYWLINYDASCPSGWFAYESDCYTNSPATRVTGRRLTAKDLATVELSGSATAGGEDQVSLSLGSGQASLASNSDSVVDLAAQWDTTEFGVYGDGGGSEAYFRPNTTLEAQTTLTATSSSAPTCVHEGFTGETNNLKLTSTPAIGTEADPTMVSEQTDRTSSTASCAVAAGS
jgi:hypothetical protein